MSLTYEIPKEELLNLEYTELLRSNDHNIRLSAEKTLGIRRVPILTPWKLGRHQIEMLQWLHERETHPYMGIAGGIVAAEMGLGKTLTASVHVLSRPRGRNPTLIVCSKTLMNSWKTDLIKFFGEEWVNKYVVFLHREFLSVSGLNEITRERIREAEFVVTAYPSCSSAHKSYVDRLASKKESSHCGLDVLYDLIWTRVILDESQNIANPSTAMFVATKALKREYSICLTGTPFRNVDGDVLSQLLFLGITPAPAAKAWDVKRFHNLGLDKVILTMDYEYANVQIPDKDDFFIDVKMSTEEKIVYHHIETRAQEIYDEMEKGLVKYQCVLEMLLRLRQFCLAPYLLTQAVNFGKTLDQMGAAAADSEIATWLTNKHGTAGLNSAKMKALTAILEGLANEKVVVFSYFSGYLRLVADILESSGRPYFVMDGSVSTKERAKIVERFSKEDKPWVLLLNYKIGSEGLNLQACNNAVFTDLCWNASGMKQAARRFWRIGQEKEVHCYYLLVENSIESRMMEICEDKADAMKKYLDGEDTKLDKNVVGRIIGRRSISSQSLSSSQHSHSSQSSQHSSSRANGNDQVNRDCRDEVILVA